MQEQFENKFSIRRINKSSDDEYIKALNIYNATTPTDIKTNTNEITYWLNKKDEVNPFEMLLFALYLDNSLIGLAMLCYIKKQRIIVYDYIALVEKYRVNTVFFPFINLLQNYINSHGYDVAYFVVEISNKNNGKSIDKESILFKKLICLEGFGRICAKYLTLPLGLSNHESSFEAYVYIKSSDDLNQISKDTYLGIVQGIYYEYYLTWYSFMPQNDLLEYKQKIDTCYDSITKKVLTELSFEIIHAECTSLDDTKVEKTFGYLPSRSKRNLPIYLIILVVLLISPIILILGYNYILQKLNIPLSSVNSVIGAIFGSILSSMTAFLIAKKKS